jgi:hypothetical protein
VTYNADDNWRSIYAIGTPRGRPETVLPAACLDNLPNLKFVRAFQEVYYPGFTAKVLESFIPSNTIVHLGGETRK